MKENILNDVLVAAVPEVKDWLLLTEKLWYRIPNENRVPSNIVDGTAKYIAFYHNSKYKDELKYKIVHWAKISQIVQATRSDLFPKETTNPHKANRQYFKVEFEELKELEKPIVSRQGRRLLFVPTTSEKLFCGKTTINHLFKTSHLEKKMVAIMEDMNISFDREWYETVDDKHKYHLDFAIFCKLGKIDVECDGNQYHMGDDNVHYDKTRNNELEGDKWKVLRYTTKHFNEDEAHIRKTLRKAVVQYKGCLELNEPQMSYNTTIDAKGQIRLF